MGVLDDMTKGITQRKAEAAGPRLTPVGVEGNVKPSLGIPDVPEVFLTNEAVKDIARDLRRQADILVTAANGLDNLTKEPTGEKADTKTAAKDAVKEAEKAADAKHKAKQELPEVDIEGDNEGTEFDKRFADLKAEAIAAFFTSSDAEPEPTPESPTITPATGGWECPVHGAKSLKQLTSRAQREYMACQVAGCKKFEK